MARNKRFLFSLALALVAAAASSARATTVAERKSLTLDGGRAVIAAAQAEARRLNAPGGVVAVVDAGGDLVALERLDGTFTAGARVSVGKAKTAVAFKKPTKFFEDVIRNGRTAMVALEEFTPLQGGVPILVDGQGVGGVGVSGAASAAQDEELALAGAKALEAPPAATVTFLDKARVEAAFTKGEPLLETGDYKIHASRREKAGLAEVHEHETDIIRVLSGAAHLVTGGTLVDSKVTAPGEIRGGSISNGSARDLAPGDVVVVPAGVPHWFERVNGPFTYYVVKVVR
ncbi:MAG TPA: heme-binding protein [Thermoanaerobaculia bacterium]|nr:heme-binding protein [Thermoanaerobaculia bacterium]